MLDALKMYLCDQGLDELYELLLRAFHIFDARDLDYDHIYESLMHEAPGKEAEQELDDLHHETHQLLDQIMTSYAVKPTMESALIDKVRVIEGLMGIEDYLDRMEMLLVLSNTDIESLDRAVMVLELTSEYNADKLYEVIEEANIDYFKENLEDTTTAMDRGVEEVAARVRKFNKFCGEESLHFIQLLRSGVDLGYNLELYADLLDHHLTELPPETAAKNMIAAALASDDAADNVAVSWSKYLEVIFPDPEMVTKVSVAMNKLMMEFASYEPA